MQGINDQEAAVEEGVRALMAVVAGGREAAAAATPRSSLDAATVLTTLTTAGVQLMVIMSFNRLKVSPLLVRYSQVNAYVRC